MHALGWAGWSRVPHLISAAEDVHLVDEEDDLLAPLPDVLQKSNLAVCERAVCIRATLSAAAVPTSSATSEADMLHPAHVSTFVSVP